MRMIYILFKHYLDDFRNKINIIRLLFFTDILISKGHAYNTHLFQMIVTPTV